MTFSRAYNSCRQLAGGVRKLLPELNGGCGPLLNAENVTVTAEGRVFATGSAGAFEIIEFRRDGEVTYEYRGVPITAPGVEPPVMCNGITSDADHLYTVALRIDDASLLPFTGKKHLKDFKINPLNAGLLLGLIGTRPMQAFVVRADLDGTPMRFDEGVALPGGFFANGLECDGESNLYVAGGALFSGRIHRVDFAGSPTTLASRRAWHADTVPGAMLDGANGVKVWQNQLFYTGSREMPFLMSWVNRVDIENGGGGKTHIVRTDHSVVFDDLDVVSNGYVIAVISDLLPEFRSCDASRLDAGHLRIVERNGALKGIFRDPDLLHPAAVKVVRADCAFLQAGEIVVADKGQDCISVITPDDAWRYWLLGRA